MDLQELMPWLGAIALILSLGNTVFGVFTSGSKENAKKITALEGEREALAARVQKLESEMEHMPDQNALHRLELGLAAMQTEIVRLAASAEQSARTSARVETYLLEKGK